MSNISQYFSYRLQNTCKDERFLAAMQILFDTDDIVNRNIHIESDTRKGAEKRGAWFCPNPIRRLQTDAKGKEWFLAFRRNRRADNVIQCQTIFLEYDNLSLVDQSRKLEDLFDDSMVQPSVICFSGNKSFHSFFRLTDPLPMDEWKQLQKWFIDYCGGDSQCKDPARLMRLPGLKEIGVEEQTILHIGQRIETSVFLKWASWRGYQYQLPKPRTPYVPPKGLTGNMRRDVALVMLDKATAEMHNAASGTRNNTLFKMSAKLAPYVSDGSLSESEVRQALESAALSAGLEYGELITINRGLDAGKGNNPWYPDFNTQWAE